MKFIALYTKNKEKNEITSLLNYTIDERVALNEPKNLAQFATVLLIGVMRVYANPPHHPIVTGGAYVRNTRTHACVYVCIHRRREKKEQVV